MVDKILGGTDPATDILFTLTEGIGKPLRPVDNSSGGSQTITVQTETILSAASTVTQQPGALNTPLQLTLGGAQANAIVDLSAAGAITFLEADEYQVYIRLNIGRQGSGSTAVVYSRALVNGVQYGSTVLSRIDSENDVNPATFLFDITPNVNDVLTFQIMRSTQGTSAGGVFFGNPSVAGWALASSVAVNISRNVAIAS